MKELNLLKLSIIVPAMNSGKFVNTTLESIQKQTFSNIEVLMVYTESFDDTKAILEKYAREDKRFILLINDIHKGVAYSRNIGLSNASGEYITFVDSDDIISPDIYTVLIDNIEKNNADIAICKETSHIKELDKLARKEEKSELLSRGEGQKYFLEGKLFYAEVWNKVFTKKVISGMFFSPKGIADDVLFTWQAISNAKKIVYVPYKLYFYRYNANGISKQKFSYDNYTGLQDVYLIIESDINPKNIELFDALQKRKRIIQAQNYIKYCLSKNNDEQLLKEIHSKKCHFCIYRNFKLKEQLLGQLYAISPKFLLILYKIYNRFKRSRI